MFLFVEWLNVAHFPLFIFPLALLSSSLTSSLCVTGSLILEEFPVDDEGDEDDDDRM